MDSRRTVDSRVRFARDHLRRCAGCVPDRRGLRCTEFNLHQHLQELIPGKVLGRVTSIVTLGSIALIPFGSGLVGWATDHAGAPTIFILSGILTALLAALALLHPVIRNLD